MLSADFAMRLHKQMFGDVWKWAGAYRTTARNIGIDAWRIGVEIAQLMGDARDWVDNKTYPPDEIAVRFITGWSLFTPFRMATVGTRGSWPTF